MISLLLLASVCVGLSWSTRRETTGRLRHRLHLTLVWLLWSAVAWADLTWVLQANPDVHPARTVAGSLALLMLVVYGSPMCKGLPFLEGMPRSPWLYAISASLTAFVIFVANPISFYISSADFVGSVYGIAGSLSMIFLVSLTLLTSLYFLLEEPGRKGLTLLAVFSACCVITYSALGVKDGGIMTHFLLAFPQGLQRTTQQVLTEVILLLAALAGASYATLKFRQNVTYVIGAMLITSIVATGIDLQRGKEASASGSGGQKLPQDHADIMGFSRERNILIVMLDGFPGGYLHTLLNEAPELLNSYEGFTWYPNTLSSGINTLGAIGTLAGGPRYSAQEINKRNYPSIGSALRESYDTYITAFVPKGYHLTYVNPAFVENCERLAARIHCFDSAPYGLLYHRREAPEAPLLEGESHLPLILSMVSLLKVVPYCLKSLVYDEERYLGANSTSVKHAAANTAKILKGWGFLHMLARESNPDSPAKTFKFIQLEIPHWPNALNQECKLQPARSSIAIESACALKELGLLFGWMKHVGIYDVTKIVVVSDHGYYIDNPMLPDALHPLLSTRDGLAWMPGLVQPLLLVKDFEAKGVFRRSDTFLSNSDVPSIVCAAVEKCQDIGPSPLTHNLGPRTLSLAITGEPPELTAAQKFDIKSSFEVSNSIFAPENWKRIQ